MLVKFIYLYQNSIIIVKVLTILLLGAIFPVLIVTFQFSPLDESFGDEEISQDKDKMNIVYTINPKYQIHQQGIIRNGDGQLVNVTENIVTGAYIPHKIPDKLFENLMGEIEMITIDGIMYEKIEYETSAQHPEIVLHLILCGSDADCVVFNSQHWWLPTEANDTLTAKWTILREMT